jgi:hypothetical protein
MEDLRQLGLRQRLGARGRTSIMKTIKIIAIVVGASLIVFTVKDPQGGGTVMKGIIGAVLAVLDAFGTAISWATQ